MTNEQFEDVRPLRTIDDLYAVMVEVRDLLQAAAETVQRYCMRLEEDGVEICPGGVPVGPSFYQGKRTLDKWQHLLPESKHGDALNKRGVKYFRMYHSPYSSETTLVPAGDDLAPEPDVIRAGPEPVEEPAEGEGKLPTNVAELQAMAAQVYQIKGGEILYHLKRKSFDEISDFGNAWRVLASRVKEGAKK